MSCTYVENTGLSVPSLPMNCHPPSILVCHWQRREVLEDKLKACAFGLRHSLSDSLKSSLYKHFPFFITMHKPAIQTSSSFWFGALHSIMLSLTPASVFRVTPHRCGSYIWVRVSPLQGKLYNPCDLSHAPLKHSIFEENGLSSSNPQMCFLNI